jgi:hypothetical protein
MAKDVIREVVYSHGEAPALELLSNKLRFLRRLSRKSSRILKALDLSYTDIVNLETKLEWIIAPRDCVPGSIINIISNM